MRNLKEIKTVFYIGSLSWKLFQFNMKFGYGRAQQIDKDAFQGGLSDL